ncbi:MAG: DUF4397 domain-containing protein [Acidimicrobiia bacterium]|nr:DUF4397 domain-containing protein [Acidimicrobiia bacterium]
MRKPRLGIFTAMLITGLMAFTGIAAAQTSGGKVTVVHGIPGLTVDVYVNGALTLEDFQPGDVAGPLDLPAGDYDLAIAAADDDIANAVLTGQATVTDGLNASIIAHLQADGTPTIGIFVNDTSTIEAGDSRLIVRHTAAAPTVDILLADGTELFTGVSNPQEGVVDVPAGTYDVEIAPTGAGVAGSAFSAPGVGLPEGTAVIVYATGDLAAGSFGLVVQTISGLGAAPAAVPTGSGDLATTSNALPIAFAGIALLGLAVAAPRLRRQDR